MAATQLGQLVSRQPQCAWVVVAWQLLILSSHSTHGLSHGSPRRLVWPSGWCLGGPLGGWQRGFGPALPPQCLPCWAGIVAIVPSSKMALGAGGDEASRPFKSRELPLHVDQPDARSQPS